MHYHDRPHFLLLSICAVQFLLVAFLAPILGTFSTPSAEVFRRRKKKKISFFIRNESNREQLLSRKFLLLLLLLFWGCCCFLFTESPATERLNRHHHYDKRKEPAHDSLCNIGCVVFVIVPVYSFGSTSFTLTNFVFFFFFFFFLLDYLRGKWGNGNLN